MLILRRRRRPCLDWRIAAAKYPLCRHVLELGTTTVKLLRRGVHHARISLHRWTIHPLTNIVEMRCLGKCTVICGADRLTRQYLLGYGVAIVTLTEQIAEIEIGRASC